nr:nucleotidyltransferase domain-containing protein [uncultured Devosia sp.]
MALLSMALFGSRARGDDEAGSDVDILLITEETKPRMVSTNRMSFSFYPASWLLDKATKGDLFVLHLVREGKVIYDERGDFDSMSKAFRLRKSYGENVEQASSLGRFLVRYGVRFEDTVALNKRIAWCVRTILIARAAEAGNAIFSAKALAAFAGSSSVEELIKNKDSLELDNSRLRDFAGFLDRWGESNASDAWQPHRYLEHFRTTGNELALRTYFVGIESGNAEYF